MFHQVAAKEPIVAQSVLDFYKSIIDGLLGVLTNTLLVVVVLGTAITYITTRSWTRTLKAAIGGVIILAIFANRSTIQNMFGEDLKGMGPTPQQHTTTTHTTKPTNQTLT